jgi:cytochrome P450
VQPQFLLLSRDIGAVVRPNPTPEVMRRGEESAREGIRLLREVSPHARPQSLLWNLQRHAESGRISDDEVFATCVMLMAAGHETTMHLVGNGMLATLQRGIRLTNEHLTVDKGTSPLVEELLRLESPLQMVARVAARDCTLGGHVISAGEQVVVLLGAANRDPRAFPEPSEFKTGRSGRHVAFGQGPHRCLGAALARYGCATVFAEFFRRFPDATLTAGATPAWRESLALRGLKALFLDLPSSKEKA